MDDNTIPTPNKPANVAFYGGDLSQSHLNKASQDKFKVVMTVPKIMKDINTQNVRANNLVNLESIQLSHTSILIPGHKTPPKSLKFGGQTHRVTSQAREEFPEITVKFVIDNNFNNYYFLWKWQDFLNDHWESKMSSYFNQNVQMAHSKNLANKISKDVPQKAPYKHISFENSFMDYATTITVQGLREYEEPIIEFTYHDAFITSLGEIDYDVKQSEQLECSFQFAFGRMTVDLLPFLED